MSDKINLAELRECFQPQTGEHRDCPVCGEGYPSSYPSGINERVVDVLALIDAVEAAHVVIESGALVIHQEWAEAETALARFDFGPPR